jgi:large subunit ribosomal protein L20
MARVRGGPTRKRRHKKLLRRARGYRMTRSSLYKSAHEAVLHAGEYAYAGRRRKKRDFRRLWIIRINARLKEHEINYSSFIHLLKENNIEIDRKVLSFFASSKPEIFSSIVSQLMKAKKN